MSPPHAGHNSPDDCSGSMESGEVGELVSPSETTQLQPRLQGKSLGLSGVLEEQDSLGQGTFIMHLLSSRHSAEDPRKWGRGKLMGVPQQRERSSMKWGGAGPPD